MPLDTNSIIDESPPRFEDAPALGDPTADNDEGAESEAAHEADHAEAAEALAEPVRRFSWTRVLALGVLPGLALALALGVGYLKWQDGLARDSQAAAAKSVQVATESTIAMLSYRPDTVDKNLTAAGDRLTGAFRGAYSQLIRDVVIPGSKQKRISAVATVPAAAPVSATADHAVVLVFVDQTTIIGDDPPTNTTSSVRVTLDKVHDRWLISQFDPV